MTLLSVTEVRNALRCPRIFALGRAHGREVVFPVTASSLGAAFHRIVSRFSQTIATPPKTLSSLSQGATEAEIAAALRAAILDTAAEELERVPSYASMPTEVDDLAEALREFADYVANSAAHSGEAPCSAVQKFLEDSEREIDDTLDLGGGTSIAMLKGRLDALHRHHSGALDVVEYKLTPQTNDELDRAQVALYRYLLSESLEIDAQAVVLRFQPKLTTGAPAATAADPKHAGLGQRTHEVGARPQSKRLMSNLSHARGLLGRVP